MAVKMSIKGVLFDLYGTLMIYGDMSAARSDWVSELHVSLQKLGLTMSRESLAERCDGFFSKNEPPDLEAGLTVFERRIQALCVDMELSVKAAAIKRIATRVADVWQTHVMLDPDCHLVLEELQRSRVLGLITNFDHPPHVYSLLRHNSIEGFLTTVIVSGDVGIRKPDPMIFQLALNQAGLQPNEAVYITDTEVDVSGSLGAGITPILIERTRPTQDGCPCRSAVGCRTERTRLRAPNMADLRTIGSLPELLDVLGLG